MSLKDTLEPEGLSAREKIHLFVGFVSFLAFTLFTSDLAIGFAMAIVAILLAHTLIEGLLWIFERSRRR